MKVVFQPHRYSRTKALARQFADELSIADDLFLMPTYSAFEKFDAEGAVESISGYLPPRLRVKPKCLMILIVFAKRSELLRKI